LNIRFLIFV